MNELSEPLTWSCDQFLFSQQMGKQGYRRVSSMGRKEATVCERIPKKSELLCTCFICFL